MMLRVSCTLRLLHVNGKLTCKTFSHEASVSFDEWDLRVLSGTSHFRETFLNHLSGCHFSSMVPEMCARGVKTLTEWIVKMDTYPVAYGGSSDVWRCFLRRKWMPEEKVAVKAIRPIVLDDEEFRVKKQAVQRELAVWIRLKHPNVLPLYGTTKGFGPFPAFVCPWADHGTLSEYLEKFEERLDLKERMALLRDISIGLQYLHSHKVVHGDLSGENILITSDGRACLSDFGLSTLLDTKTHGSSFPGNIRWAAPELFDASVEESSASQLATCQADIYSFGSVMLQILTGKLPFHWVQRVAQIVIVMSQGGRPPREPRWDGGVIPDTLWQFIEACWAPRPSERPSCEEVVDFVKRQLSMMS